ncbi:MAG: hypothetical protein EOP10_08770, partial [Proteobacteria bacterium]
MKSKHLAVVLAFMSVLTEACKPRDEVSQTPAPSAHTSAPSNLLSLDSPRAALIGDFLTRIANRQYDLVDSNSTFFIDEKAITNTIDGCAKSYFQLKTYTFDSSATNLAYTQSELEAWNKEALARNKTTLQILENALAKSSCAFKDGDLRTSFPEFFAFDDFWSKAYDVKGFLTDDDYEETAKAQPILIDQAEFL